MLGFAAGFVTSIYWYNKIGLYYALASILFIFGVFAAIQTKGEKISAIVQDENMTINIFNIMFRQASKFHRNSYTPRKALECLLSAS